MKIVGFAPMDAGIILCADCAADDIASEDDARGSVVWDTSETDTPTHCDECGALVAEDLTDDGREYVKEELGRFIHAAVFGGHGGSAAVLDEWRAEYGSTLEDDKLLALYDKTRERQRAVRSVIFTGHESGYGRSYGTTEDGSAWTTHEHDSGATDSGPDECAECGTPVYSGWLCLDGGEVVCSSHVVTPSDVRATAGAWHGGQRTALYSLASSGVVQATAVYELRHALHDLDDASRPSSMTYSERQKARAELRAALAYCEAKTGSAADRFVIDLAAQAVHANTPDQIDQLGRVALGMLTYYGIGSDDRPLR